MVHLLGVNLKDAKLVRIALQGFYGIGTKTALEICTKLQIHGQATLSSLKESKMASLTTFLSNMKLENELRRQVRTNIARYRDIGSYRGRRHAAGYPVNGQNTRNNALTARKLNRLERRG